MANAGPRPLDDNEFDDAVRRLVDDAERSWRAYHQRGREDAWRRFNATSGGVDHKPAEGGDDTAMPEIRDTIFQLLPELLEQLAGTEEATEYYATDPNLVPAARAATKAASSVFWEAGGWEALHDAIMNAGVAQIGVMKTWRRERLTSRITMEQDIPSEALDARLQQNPRTQVLSREDRPIPAGFDPYGNPVMRPGTSTAQLRVISVERRTMISSVDPAHFAMTDALHEDEALCIGEWSAVRFGDLARMGFDPDDLRDVGGVDRTRQRRGRQERGEPEVSYDSSDFGSWSLRPVDMGEFYVRLDRDGDGIPERWKVIVAGNERKVLAAEPVREQPYSLLVVRRKPNDIGGYSLCDLLWDLQEARTKLLRAMLDNVDQVNSPAVFYSGAVRWEELQSWQKWKTINEVTPGSVRFDRPPPTLSETMPLFEALDALKEGRVGVSRMAQGLRPDSLTGTAAVAIAGAFQAAQRALALIVRTVAESGLRPTYQRLLPLLADEDQRLVEGFGVVEGRQFRSEDGEPLPFGVRIKAGLGAVSKQERMGAFRELIGLATQLAGAQGGYARLTSPTRAAMLIRDAVAEFRGLGAERYFTSPEEMQQIEQAMQQQGPPPDPEMAEVQRKAQEGQAKVQVAAQKAQMDAQQRAQAAQQTAQARLIEARLKDAREREEMLQKGLLQAVDIQTQAQLKREEIRTRATSRGGTDTRVRRGNRR